jgi:hypothetical protein
MRISHRAYILLAGTLGVLFIATALLFYQYWQATQNQSDAIVGRVDAIVETPSEKPTVATVRDTGKLSSPVLRSQARSGDVLLVYSRAKRLVLYRPATQKVVEMLTINN